MATHLLFTLFISSNKATTLLGLYTWVAWKPILPFPATESPETFFKVLAGVMLQLCPQAGDLQRPVLRSSGMFSLQTSIKVNLSLSHLICYGVFFSFYAVHQYFMQYFRWHNCSVWTLEWCLLSCVCFFVVVFLSSVNICTYSLLCLQGTATRSGSPRDQEWLDQLNHILQQKVRHTNMIYSCTASCANY